MRLALVTAAKDRRHLLESTVLSVLSQRAAGTEGLEIDYLVVDGASTDGTIEMLTRLSHGPISHGIDFRWMSEPDSGLGEALAKGFSRVRGHLYGYLGAGDLLWPSGLISLGRHHAGDDDWLCGLHTTFDAEGRVSKVSQPWRYRGDFIRRGLYGRTVLPHLQQESTFWGERLMRLVDLDGLARLRAATDAYLWRAFAEQGYSPRMVEDILGGWRDHGEHLAQTDHFPGEVARIYPPVTTIDRVAATVEYVRWRLRTPNISGWLQHRRRVRGAP